MTRAFCSEALEAQGRMVEFDAGKPVVEFVDRDGHSQRVVGAVSSTPPPTSSGRA